VKLWTSILVAGAVLAILAPSAFSAGAAIPSDPASGTQHQVVRMEPATLVKHLLVGKKQAAKIKALTARNKALAAKLANMAAQSAAQAATNRAQADRILELDAWVWAHTDHPAPPAVDPDSDCLDYMVCTPEQDCRLWGNNCNLVNPPAPLPEVSAPETPADGNGSDNGGGVVTPQPTPAPLECASMVDPAIVDQNPDQYDSTC
jgi:hypothetical protein